MGWQDISTAPKDGQSILLAEWASLARTYSYVVGRWHVAESEVGITGWYIRGGLSFGPTHWHPLPEPPPAPPENPK